MALVRCPIHRIPYNDDRPNGCPACERERAGDNEADAIKALAKASKTLRASDDALDALPPEPEEDAFDLAGAVAGWDVATQWKNLTNRPRLLWLAISLILAAIIVLVVVFRGPRFVEVRFPAEPTEDIRPLAIEPNTPIQLAFSMLGVQPAKPHPQSSLLARYEYGSDLVVDVLNDVVYAVTLAVPGRTWRGLRVGLTERNAMGLLALLGPPQDGEPETVMAPRVIRGFEAYPSVEQRPRRVHKVEVRPPNGCFDVLVDVRPRVVGLLVSGDARRAVVARRGEPAEWVVTRIRVASRALPDTTFGEIVC